MKAASKAPPDRAVRRVTWAPLVHESPSKGMSVDARLRLAAQNAASQVRKVALDKPDTGYDPLRPDGWLATDPQAAEEVARGLEAMRLRFSQ